MASTETDNNASGSNNAEKAYLRQREEGMKEIEKLDMTNPVMLLDKLPSYSDTNEHVFWEIVLNLDKLSESTPDTFLQYPALFDVFFNILYNPFIEYENIVKNVIHILKNISRTPKHIAILKMKLDREDLSTRMTNVLRGLFITSEILPIFDMRAIMASEGEPPHVYAMQGHGCVFDKRPPIVVPKGIIWIELTVCGLVAFTYDIKKFINYETKRFLENTPIPTDEPLQQKYRADLGALTDYGIGVKFPGQSIADGKNTLFLQALTKEGTPTDIFFKSGIDRLYTKPLNIDDYKAVKESEDTLSKIYSDSIYPTLEQVMDDEPTQDNYRITFKNLFASIESQDYEVTKPMILINAACRTPCGADSRFDAPALRRKNSEEAKTKMVSELPIGELFRRGRDGQTYLMSLIKQKLFRQARLLMERVERELGVGVLGSYLTEEHILESIRYEGEPIIGETMQVVPKEFKDLIQSKISESEIRIKFDELRRLMNEGDDWKWKNAFMKILALSALRKEEIIGYEGFFDTLLRILDKKKKYMAAYVSEMITYLARNGEDKARLVGLFFTIPAADGIRGESIAELREILKARGVIKKGGTRKNKRSRKSRRTVRRNR